MNNTECGVCTSTCPASSIFELVVRKRSASLLNRNLLAYDNAGKAYNSSEYSVIYVCVCVCVCARV